MNRISSLTVMINGREALPIRAILHLTGWMFRPSYVIEMIIDHKYILLDEVKAYRIDNRKCCKIQPYEMLRFTSNDDLDYPKNEQQRINAIKAIPSGIFVWFDEFFASLEATKKMRKSDPKQLSGYYPIAIHIFVNPHVERSMSELITEDFEEFLRKRGRKSASARTKFINALRKETLRIYTDNPKINDTHLASMIHKMSFNTKPYSESYIRTMLRELDIKNKSKTT